MTANDNNTTLIPQGGWHHSYSISLIRLLSLVFIVTCHVQQYLHSELAWWFNVGVQLFLCISGFLYGQKEIGEVSGFYRKRFTKILIPYYIVLFTACLLQFIFVRDTFSLINMVAGLICRGAIKGGEHLWFIRYILLCYVLTPLLQVYKKNVSDSKGMWRLAVVSVAIGAIWFILFNKIFVAAWMVCYIIGYMLGVNEEGKYIKNSALLVLFGVVAILGNGVRVYYAYILHVKFPAYNYFCDFSHMFLGVFLFCFSRACLTGFLSLRGQNRSWTLQTSTAMRHISFISSSFLAPLLSWL